jgi:hypothetical protein
VTALRQVKHEPGDDEQRHRRRRQHEHQLARPAEHAAAVQVEDAHQHPLAGGFVGVDLRRRDLAAERMEAEFVARPLCRVVRP